MRFRIYFNNQVEVIASFPFGIRNEELLSEKLQKNENVLVCLALPPLIIDARTPFIDFTVESLVVDKALKSDKDF